MGRDGGSSVRFATATLLLFKPSWMAWLRSVLGMHEYRHSSDFCLFVWFAYIWAAVCKYIQTMLLVVHVHIFFALFFCVCYFFSRSSSTKYYKHTKYTSYSVGQFNFWFAEFNVGLDEVCMRAWVAIVTVPVCVCAGNSNHEHIKTASLRMAFVAAFFLFLLYFENESGFFFVLFLDLFFFANTFFSAVCNSFISDCLQCHAHMSYFGHVEMSGRTISIGLSLAHLLNWCVDLFVISNLNGIFFLARSNELTKNDG